MAAESVIQLKCECKVSGYIDNERPDNGKTVLTSLLLPYRMIHGGRKEATLWPPVFGRKPL